MTSRRWLYLSGLALIAATLIGPKVMPLYDGVGFPDLPYEYVGSTNPPSPVEQSVPAADLNQYTTTLQTLESGPQVQVFFDVGSITLPHGATEVTLEAKPETPTGTLTSGKIPGNVYLITAASNPGPPHINTDRAKIFERLPQNTPSKTPVVMVYRPEGGAWRELATTKPGNDVYEARFAGVGEYALAVDAAPSPSAKPTSPAGTPSSHQALLLTALVVGLILVVLLLIRLASVKSHEPPKG